MRKPQNKEGVFMVTTRASHSEEVARTEIIHSEITREGRVQRGVPAVTIREPSEERATKAEIARERRPEPVGNVRERKIGGKFFKLGRVLDQIA